MEASFTAATVLVGISVLNIRFIQRLSANNRNMDNSYILFAVLPLFFSALQFTEGIVWYGLEHNYSAKSIALFSSVYLFFAYTAIPTVWPLSIYLIERNVRKRKIMKIICVLGALTGLYLLASILYFDTTAIIKDHSIFYVQEVPYITIPRIFYISVLLTACLSTHGIVRIMGVATVAACVISYYLYWTSFVSVWCFFAALISLLVLFQLRAVNLNQPQSQ